MPFFSLCVTFLFGIMLFLTPAPVIANTAAATDSLPGIISDIKYFSLNHKEVIAIAVETSLPSASVADPLIYTYEPQYRLTEKNNSLILSIAATLPADAPWAVEPANTARLFQLKAGTGSTDEFTITAAYNPLKSKASISTVKRKRVIRPDNTIVFRTYLVLTFADLSQPAAKTLVLDPGHGGNALGAVSNGLLEKELNLDIALLTYERLCQQGYDVYMTRTDDSNPGLLDRADAANILHADLFLSIHNNSVPTDMADEAKKLYRGTTALYNSAAPKPAKDLAKLLADELSSTLRIHQYPLQDRPKLVVLNSTWVPAVIAEVAMMPHPQDAKMLSQRIYRQQAADAIVQAIQKYFSLVTLTYQGEF